MNGKRIDDTVEYLGTLSDGRAVLRSAAGHINLQEARSDFARVERLSDNDVDRASSGDRDFTDFEDVDWSTAEWMPPLVKKRPISIRVDEDVLTFFQEAGPGYQKRMNAVLRRFMEESRRTKRTA